MNLKLDLDYKKFLPYLKQAQPYIIGFVLIGLFGFTAYVVNQALNVKPASTATVTVPPKIGFDKKAVDAIKSLNVTSGQVPTADLGTADPFGN